MRDTNEDGICDYADKHPILDEDNSLSVDIFYQASGTAETISGQNKDFKYVKPSEVESLMNMYEVPIDERQEMMVKVLTLQDIDNLYRPNRPKPKR